MKKSNVRKGVVKKLMSQLPTAKSPNTQTKLHRVTAATVKSAVATDTAADTAESPPANSFTRSQRPIRKNVSEICTTHATGKTAEEISAHTIADDSPSSSSSSEPNDAANLDVIDLPLDPAVQPSDLLSLSDQQERAMLALSRGQSVTAAALAAGVHRGTVHRWLRDSADFTAAYNAWQSELRQSARTRLMRLADQAVDVVTNALQTHDAKTAVALLKNFALLAPIDPGSTSAEVIRHEWEREKKQEERKREIEKAMMELGMI